MYKTPKTVHTFLFSPLSSSHHHHLFIYRTHPYRNKNTSQKRTTETAPLITPLSLSLFASLPLPLPLPLPTTLITQWHRKETSYLSLLSSPSFSSSFFHYLIPWSFVHPSLINRIIIITVYMTPLTLYPLSLVNIIVPQPIYPPTIYIVLVL